MAATLLASSVMAVPVHAQPTTTITFDEIALPAPPATAVPLGDGGVYVTGGYQFGCVNIDDGTACRSLFVPGPVASHFTGSAAVYNNNIFGITTLARADGGAFDLVGISMSPLGVDLTGPVLFEAMLAGGGTVTQTFTLGGTPGTLTPFTFSPLFQDIVAVRWFGNTSFSGFADAAPVFDDIVVRASTSVAVVPEPATFALLGGGLLALGGVRVRWRRRIS